MSAEPTMIAAVIDAPGRVCLREVEMPRPQTGQVRVKLEGCGVCASNVPPWEGRPWFKYPLSPGQLGHEGWGRIDALGDAVRDLRVGDRVAMLSEHAYAEHDVASQDSVVKLAAALEGRPFPAEPLACAVNIFARSGIEAGQTVAIVGIGFLGALLCRMASDAGARVIAVSRRATALRAAQRMGAEHIVEMDDRAADHVRQLAGERLCQVVVEATGKQRPLDMAAELTGIRGRLVIGGYHQDGPRQCNLQLWNWRGIDVINAHERDPEVYLRGMKRAMGQVIEGKLDPSPLYTHRFGLAQLGEALEVARSRPEGFIKGLVVMDGRAAG